jgi:hypothetical protein
MQAYQRAYRRPSLPVVNRTLQADQDTEAFFLFSLMKGDTVEMDYDGARRVCRVKKFYAGGQIWFTSVNNAQNDEDLKRFKATWSKRPNTLKAVNARKVVVDVLGRVHPAND